MPEIIDIDKAKDRIVAFIDELTRNMSRSEYKRFLDILGSEVDIREECIRDEEAREMEGE